MAKHLLGWSSGLFGQMSQQSEVSFLPPFTSLLEQIAQPFLRSHHVSELGAVCHSEGLPLVGSVYFERFLPVLQSLSYGTPGEAKVKANLYEASIHILFSLNSIFLKNKSRPMQSIPPPLPFDCLNKSFFMKLYMYIVAAETISAAYFINPSHRSVCVCVSLLSLLGKGSIKCMPLSLLGNASVNTFPRQRRINWRSRFLLGPCRIKGRYAITFSKNFLF
jgi:hypothetical protein